MIKCIKTNSKHQDFINLVKALDADLAIRDGAEHNFYAQFNKIDLIKHVIVAYENDEVVGCGALKEFTHDKMEVKRMYVKPTHRGKGIASIILKKLENWCKELGYKKCLLETGKKQPEAIRLYEKNNYKLIPNFGQYANVENSLCFEKMLIESII